MQINGIYLNNYQPKATYSTNRQGFINRQNNDEVAFQGKARNFVKRKGIFALLVSMLAVLPACGKKAVTPAENSAKGCSNSIISTVEKYIGKKSEDLVKKGGNVVARKRIMLMPPESMGRYDRSLNGIPVDQFGSSSKTIADAKSFCSEEADNLAKLGVIKDPSEIITSTGYGFTGEASFLDIDCVKMPTK